jgi:chaperonin GroES
MQPTALTIMEETGDLDLEAVDDLVATFLDDLPKEDRILAIAQSQGDLTPILSEQQLASIGAKCKEDYESDKQSCCDWREQAEKSIKRAKQDPTAEKAWPWKGAANANHPILASASLQFAARAYPAIVKGDEAVSCKVVGSDKGLPELGQDGEPIMMVDGMMLAMGPQGPVLVDPQSGQGQPIPPEQAEQVMQAAQPKWKRAPGVKTKRAQRVRDFMNYTIFYRMKGWEEDTDTLLHHLPIVGCGFRKVYYDGQQRAAYVPALKLVAPMNAKSCEESPRLTEIRDSQPLNDIVGLQRQGFYRDVVLVENEDANGLRTLLEQHCLLDLDEDGYEEPYIVTFDEETGMVLRVEANFGPDDVEVGEREVDGEIVAAVAGIRRECYYVKYDFFPNLDGGFYGLGLGHLLDPITTIVNNTINQMIDAGTAAAAGGGFIGSGVDLTGAGKRSSRIMFEPGVYKTVNASGAAIQNAIYERTFPGPNPVTFQVLELMLGAAKDISGIQDVMVGDANNNAPVGTTLALIEQGLQVFSAIYKRIFRSLKEEYSKLFQNIGAFGGEQAQEDYSNLLDDPLADFEADFNAQDFDVRPVSDPTNVTRSQRIARAQFLGTFLGAPGMNPQKIIRRMLEAADVDDLDELFEAPAQPDPAQQAMMQAELAKLVSEAKRNEATAQKTLADIGKGQDELALAAAEEERLALTAIADKFQNGLEIGART